MITNICEREYKMKEEEYKQKWKTSFALGEKVFRNAVQRQMQSDFKERIKTETLYLIPTYIKKGKMDLSESRQGIYKIIPPENENKNHPVKEIKCKPMESRLSPMDLMLANNPDQFASYIFTEHGIAVYDPGYRELREDEKELLKHWEENEFTEDHEQQVKNAVYDGLTTSTYLKQSLEAGDKEYLFGTSPKFGEVLDVKKYRLGDPKCVLSKDVPGELKEEYLIVTEKELQLQKKEQEVSWCGNIGGGSMRDTQDYELIGKYLAKHLNLAAAMSTTFQPGERNYLNFKSPEDELRFEQEDENLKDDYGFVYASNGYTNMKYLENSKFNRLYNIIDGVLRNAGEAHNSARCSQLTSVVYQTWIDTKQLDINEIHLKPMARMFASVLANHPDLSVDDLDLYSYPNSVDGNGDFNEEYAVAFYQFLQNFCLNNPPESEAWDKFFSEMEETIGNDMIDIQRDCSWELVM